MRSWSSGSEGAISAISATLASMSLVVRAASASPCSGTPRASATCWMSTPALSTVRLGSTMTTGMPASRIWSRTSQGPRLVSVMMTVGLRSRIASAARSWPTGVTSGRSAISAKVLEVSRPTIWSPRPSS